MNKGKILAKARFFYYLLPPAKAGGNSWRQFMKAIHRGNSWKAIQNMKISNSKTGGNSKNREVI